MSKLQLTGACIEDWNINSETILDDVICNYIYLKANKQERRPSNPNQNFAPGEFAKLVQKVTETVDLIFSDGIDWKAFYPAFQELQIKHQDEDLSIQAIENKLDGAFVIRLNVSEDVDKALIETQFKELYEVKLSALEAQYRAELQAKQKEITLYKQQSTDLMEIARILASRAINVEAMAMIGTRVHTVSGDYKKIHTLAADM